jgi:hypothetical protein
MKALSISNITVVMPVLFVSTWLDGTEQTTNFSVASL